MNTLLESKPIRSVASKTLKVAFIPTQVSGVVYYRMGAFSYEMRKHPRIFTQVAPFSFSHLTENPWQRDMLTMPQVRPWIESLVDWADVVVWQPLYFRHSLEFWEELKIKYQKPFLIELDDYIADIPAENEAFEAYRPGSKTFQTAWSQLSQSDALIVSTPYLAKLYQETGKPTHVIPNSIDFKGHAGRPKIVGWDDVSVKKHDRIRIGWIGGGTHRKDLEMVAPAIQEVLRKYDDAWFYCVHGCPEVYKTMEKVYWTRKWTPINLYPRAVASYGFDIGIAPLIDNNFNRGKSNLRWLEYSALRIPTIASPLPDFTRSITDGNDGLIAHDLDQWVAHLSRLIESESLRRQIGNSANNTIREKFNARKTANEYLKILRGFC